MARTRAEWNALIAGEAAIHGLSASAAAEWLLFRDLVVTIAMFFEAIIELFKSDVDTALATKQPGSLPWYPVMIDEFQYGHTLLVDENGQLYYETIDEAAQIITQRAVKETDDGHLRIKVAKEEAGETVQLTLDERNAFNDYLEARMPPGVSYTATSLPADEVKYIMTLKYDSLYNKTALLAAVDAALDEFRTGIAFPAIFYKSELIAKVRSVPGVVSVVVQIDMLLDNGAESVTNLPEEKELPAGYFIWDDTSTITATAA